MAKSRVLLIGSGGIGTIAALNLEAGGLAEVTAVLRSNYAAVEERGFEIDSCDHGCVTGWRPSHIIKSLQSIPNGQSFDFVVCTTKSVADVQPTVEIVRPAITSSHTVLVLIPNGINIEKPIFAAFPDIICLSGTSMCSSHEPAPGKIVHDSPDKLEVGAFRNPRLDPTTEDEAAQQFVRIYSAAGKTQCEFKPDVPYSRWRKLLYNAALNPICALTDLDTGRIRLADDALDTLVRPAMREVRCAAQAAGVLLDESLIEEMIASTS